MRHIYSMCLDVVLTVAQTYSHLCVTSKGLGRHSLQIGQRQQAYLENRVQSQHVQTIRSSFSAQRGGRDCNQWVLLNSLIEQEAQLSCLLRTTLQLVCVAEHTVISVHIPTATSESNLLPSSHSIAPAAGSAGDSGWLLGGFRLMHAISFSRWTCAFCTSC